MKRVFIANRGEIACRILRALRERGVEGVVGCSDFDLDSRAARMADQVVRLGPAPATESYLDVDKVVAAAVESGCDALHPGYGFLSERSALPRALEAAGVVFLGPTAETMEALGDKVAARKVAAEASVPTLPGTPDAVEADEALALGEGIGFPLLVKAAAGGGGRGMRLCERAEDLADAVKAASREAASSFGDGRVFLERYLPRPRHVEVQVLADGQGEVVYLFERECSLQRRHQKVIEEAPAPISDDLRRRLGEASVRLCQQVGYRGAGTCEFLVEGEEFFFLEMNTRLQVEHPVTELITGVDLVHEQLRIGAGEGLSFRQEDLSIRGHSIEARVYAEDPARGFLPSPGPLLAVDWPEGPGVRVDQGFETGDAVGEFYDAMLAKVITFAADRETARRRLVTALEETAICGVVTNVGYLLDIAERPEWIAGEADVRCLDRWLEGWSGRRARRDVALAAAALARSAGALELGSAAGGEPGSPSGFPSPWDTLGEVRS